MNNVAPGCARRRDGVPVVRALPAHDRVRQPRVRPPQPAACRSRRSTSGCDARARSSSSRSCSSASRSSSPAVSGSGSRSGARSSASRSRSSWTSRSRTSTQSCGSRPATEILKLQRRLGTTTIYVTHDQVEAMTMGDRIAVLRDGVLQQVGTPEDLYVQPAERLRRRFHRLPGHEPRSRRCRRRCRRLGADRRIPSGARPAARRRLRQRAAHGRPSRSSSTSETSSWCTSR